MYKINSKWIKDLNAKPGTIKVLEENIVSKLFDTNLSNVFLDTSLQARETKAKINKWNLIKLKFLHNGRHHQQNKRQPTG